MAKVYSKSISVTRGISKPTSKAITNTNLDKKVEKKSTSSSPVDATKVAGKTRTRRGCGCGRKKR